MYIKVLGASVNAAVMAYRMSLIGHHVNWQTLDKDLSTRLKQSEMIFDDCELSCSLREQMSLNLLMVDEPCTEYTYSVCILAVNNEQYLDFDQLREKFSRYKYKLVINYANLGMGKTRELQQELAIKNIVYIPDAIQEGRLLTSFLDSGLIVGNENPENEVIIREMFRPIYPLSQQYNFLSIQAAEFTKLSVSGFLAAKVSFMNDLSNVAESLGIDIEEVRVAMSMDERVGAHYLYPGCGFGGSNFTRDILKLKEVVLETGNVSGLLDKIWDINENQKEIIFRKIWKLFDCHLENKVIAFWGASFKPNSKSVAQSPILKVLEACWSQGAITQVHDPRALSELQALYPDQHLLKLYDDQYDAVDGADVLCLVTEWKQYWSPDYQKLVKKMRHPNLIDGRNIYNPLYVENQGFNYIGIGR